MSQLINGISRVLQKLLRYFNDTIILTIFVPSLPVLPAIFVLIFKKALLLLAEGKSIIAHCYLKLVHLYSIAINVLMFFNNYHDIVLNYTIVLLH